MVIKYLKSFTAVGLRLSSAWVINKLFAIYFGSAGIALLSHLQNMLGMLNILPVDGVQKGLTTNLGNSTLPVNKKKEILGAGFAWYVIVFIIFITTIFFFRSAFLNPFIGNNFKFLQILLIVICLAAQLFYLAALHILLVEERINEYLLTTLYAGMLGILCVSIVISSRNINLALLAFLVGQALPIIIILVYWYRLRNVLPAWLSANFHFSKVAFTSLGWYVFMALSLLVFGKITSFFVRQYAIDNFGLESVGWWQAWVKLSSAYDQIFAATLGSIFFPALSQRVHDSKASVIYLKKNLLLWAPVLLWVLTFIFFLKKYILIVLFSKSFLASPPFAFFQLSGDFFHLLSYFFALYLLAKSKLGIFIGLQVVSSVIYIGLLIFLIPLSGILAMPQAYFIQSSVYFFMLVMVFLMDNK